MGCSAARSASLLLVLVLAACAHQPTGERRHRSLAEVYDVRPRAWCGWWLRQQMSADPGRAFNRASHWALYGLDAGGPAAGVIVVFSHHVGIIVGRAPHGLWFVRSGNDGHAVRTRPRSLAGAIAYRLPTP